MKKWCRGNYFYRQGLNQGRERFKNFCAEKLNFDKKNAKLYQFDRQLTQCCYRHKYWAAKKVH